MEDCKYLAIKNWEKYQTVKGKMRWIKLSTDLEDDAAFMRLTVFQQWLLMRIWALRGRLNGNVSADPCDIATSLSVAPNQRTHIGQAIAKLVVRGFLVPTNQLDSSIDKIRIEESREEKTTTAPAEPVREIPKPKHEPKPALTLVEVFDLPVWINRRTWMDFELMRQKIRKPMTNRARELVVKKLKALADRGHPAEAVLEQSIVNGWQDVYELKGGTRMSEIAAKEPGKPAAPKCDFCGGVWPCENPLCREQIEKVRARVQMSNASPVSGSSKPS